MKLNTINKPSKSKICVSLIFNLLYFDCKNEYLHTDYSRSKEQKKLLHTPQSIKEVLV